MCGIMRTNDTEKLIICPPYPSKKKYGRQPATAKKKMSMIILCNSCHCFHIHTTGSYNKTMIYGLPVIDGAWE